MGIIISEGQISNILTKEKQDEFTKEKEDIFKAGMEHSEHIQIIYKSEEKYNNIMEIKETKANNGNKTEADKKKILEINLMRIII